MGYLLGLDIGTSGVKALLMDEAGHVAGSVLVEYPLHSPRPGWTEQEPEDMWQASVEAIRSVLGKCRVNGSEVKGMGLSGQMHSSVFLDENYKVIRRAILWNDTRTSGQCAAIRE